MLRILTTGALAGALALALPFAATAQCTDCTDTPPPGEKPPSGLAPPTIGDKPTAEEIRELLDGTVNSEAHFAVEDALGV